MGWFSKKKKVTPESVDLSESQYREPYKTDLPDANLLDDSHIVPLVNLLPKEWVVGLIIKNLTKEFRTSLITLLLISIVILAPLFGAYFYLSYAYEDSYTSTMAYIGELDEQNKQYENDTVKLKSYSIYSKYNNLLPLHVQVQPILDWCISKLLVITELSFSLDYDSMTFSGNQENPENVLLGEGIRKEDIILSGIWNVSVIVADTKKNLDTMLFKDSAVAQGIKQLGYNVLLFKGEIDQTGQKMNFYFMFYKNTKPNEDM